MSVKRLEDSGTSVQTLSSEASASDKLLVCSLFSVDLRGLTAMYVAALGVVGLLTVLIQIIVQVELADVAPFMHLVNDANHQRFHCNLLAKTALRAINPDPAWGFRNQSSALARNMTTELDYWIEGMKDLRDDIYKYYPELLPTVDTAAEIQRDMIASFRMTIAMLNADDGSILNTSQTLPVLSRAFDSDWHYLAIVESLTQSLTKAHEESLRILTVVEYVSVAVVVVLLFCEGFLLFRPTVQKLGRLIWRLRKEHGSAREANEALIAERQKTQVLLENVLPQGIADKLRARPDAPVSDIAKEHHASVLFADIVGFTTLSARLQPSAVIDLLHLIFTAFDQLCRERPGCEKIKTIGDAYMVAAGLGDAPINHAALLADLALDMMRQMDAVCAALSLPDLQVRIGISSGNLVSGVIGTLRFSYDIWGDTVNTASRMESSGKPHRIQVSSATYGLLEPLQGFVLKRRGKITVKGKGIMTTYWLLGRESEERSRLLREISSPPDSTTSMSVGATPVDAASSASVPSVAALRSVRPNTSVSLDPAADSFAAARRSSAPVSPPSSAATYSPTPLPVVGQVPTHSHSLPADLYMHTPVASVRTSAALAGDGVPTTLYYGLVTGTEHPHESLSAALAASPERGSPSVVSAAPSTEPSSTSLGLSQSSSSSADEVALERAMAPATSNATGETAGSTSTAAADSGSSTGGKPPPRALSQSLRTASRGWSRPDGSHESADNADDEDSKTIELAEAEPSRQLSATMGPPRPSTAPAVGQRDQPHSQQQQQQQQQPPTPGMRGAGGSSKTPLAAAHSMSFGSGNSGPVSSSFAAFAASNWPRPSLSTLLSHREPAPSNVSVLGGVLLGGGDFGAVSPRNDAVPSLRFV